MTCLLLLLQFGWTLLLLRLGGDMLLPGHDVSPSPQICTLDGSLPPFLPSAAEISKDGCHGQSRDRITL